MQILASALPGFRDLRAPLTAGYLWLVFLWIVIKPDLATRPTNEIAGSIWDLGKAVGPIWIGLAIGIAAFLIGSVSQILSPFLNWILATIWDKVYAYYEIRQIEGKRLPRAFVNYHRDPVDKYDAEALAKYRANPPKDEEGETVDYENTVGGRGYTARRGIAQEIKLPATLLLGEQPQLFSEADRLKSESQFRLAIVPPLTVVTIYISCLVTFWLLLILIPILILLWQSHIRNLEYRYLMFGAIERGFIHSNSLDDLKAWIDDLDPPEGYLLMPSNADTDPSSERELASVTITMGSGGTDNPLILQPGAILFAGESESDANPRAVWVCNLSEADYARYLDALDTLSNIYVTNLFSIALESARDMMTILGDAYKAIYANQISSVNPDDFIRWTVRIRTSILGVCAMIHHHQEQSYAEVVRKFGEASPEHEKMKKAFGSIYDNCFGYRYLYKLRNCMIHYSMRVVDVGTNSRSHQGQPLHWFGITMKRSVMLKPKKLLNAKLRAELEALDEDPEIIPMQTEAFKELIKTNRQIIEIQYPNIGEICATVREFDRLFEGGDGARGLAINRSAEIRSPFAFEFYPIAGQVIMAARRYGEITESED